MHLKVASDLSTRGDAVTHIRTRFSKSGTMAETRTGSEEFVNFPGGFVDYLIHKLEENDRKDDAQQADAPAQETQE